MSTPVTRGELREEFKQLRQELAHLATKAELADLVTKAELADLVTKVATKAEFEIWGGALLACIERTEQRLSAELARHAGAIHESMVAMFAASDEKYADLPGRVSGLEAAVFVSKQR